MGQNISQVLMLYSIDSCMSRNDSQWLFANLSLILNMLKYFFRDGERYMYFIMSLISLLLISNLYLRSEINNDDKIDFRKAKGLFDIQRNSNSNFEYFLSNYGILFNTIDATNSGGGFWPRGSINQYVFGGGLWFAAIKEHNGEDTKYCTISYNPNNGKSWLVPGRIEDGDEADENLINKYRVYFSTDMRSDGTPIIADYGPNWPLWIDNDYEGDYFGSYIHDTTLRNSDDGFEPAFISCEDVFCTYKDTDLSRYDGGGELREYMGYPLRTQWEQTIYSLEDAIIIKFRIINMSDDTLKDCWLAPLIDFDIATKLNASIGCTNDRLTYYFPDESLNMAVAWSNADLGERDNRFGYAGLSMISTPVVDDNGYIIKTAEHCDKDQLGLRTFRSWALQEDVNEDAPRYNMVSSQLFDGDKGPRDIRALMATGPFHMKPGDDAELSILINFAMPVNGGDATGEWEDMELLVENARNIQRLFCENCFTKVNVSEKNEDIDIALYPNPASDFIVIESNSLIKNVEIIDILGNLKIDYSDRSNRIMIKLEDQSGNELSSGFYSCIISTEHGRIFKRFIVL
jgi:hypothetical protein